MATKIIATPEAVKRYVLTSKQSIRDSFKRATETTGHARATAELDDRRIAEDTSGRYSEQIKRAAALRAEILHAHKGSPEEAALVRRACAEFADPTIAEQAAAAMGDDGSRSTAPDGRSLQQVCRSLGAEVWRRESGDRRYEFRDGSAIIVLSGTWDLKHPDCDCGWCWSETDAESLCTSTQYATREWVLTADALDAEDAEQVGDEYRVTLTDDALDA